MDDDGAVAGPIERHGSFEDAVVGRRPFAGRRCHCQGADIGPLVGGHGLFDGPCALVEGGRQPAEKMDPVFFGEFQVVVGDQRRVGHIDESARIDAVARHMLGDAAEQFIVERLV